MADNMTDTVTVSEAAAAWGKSERTIFRWIEQGRIESVRQGRNTFVQADKPEAAKVTVVTNHDTSDMRHDLSATTENGTMSGLLAAAINRQPRMTGTPFSWALSAATLFVVVSMMGLAGYFARDYIRRTDLQLERLAATVAVERDQAADERARANKAEGKKDELAAEVASLLKQQAEAASKQQPGAWWDRFMR